MTRRECLIVILILSLPVFLIGLATIAALIIAIMPRHHTQQLRRRLAKLIMWQWVKGMKISRIAHDLLWDAGNGKPYDYGEVG